MKIIKKFKDFSKTVKRHIVLYRRIYSDSRTPLLPRILLALAVRYILMPFDLIPDFIPVFGQLDDIIIVPLLVYTALKLIPDEIIEEYKLGMGLAN